MGKYLLAIDAGTGAGRCLIVNEEGEKISSVYREWGYTTPKGLEPYGKEFDSNYFWKTVCDLIKEAITKGGISKEEIRGVSSTSQRQGALFLDKNGRELYAGPNIDTRGLWVQDIIEESLGDSLYEIAGHAPYLIFMPARLLWFRENKPEIYKKIAHALAINDWILFKLSGVYATEPSTASESLLFDIHRVEWSDRIIDALEFSEDILPKLGKAGDPTGEVTQESSIETGLKKGTSVIIGGPDIECGLLGCKVLKEGEVGATLGTTAPIQIVTSKPVIDSKKRTWSSCHIIPSEWVVESNAQMAGSVYRWFRDKIINERENRAGKENKISYKEMDEMVLKEGVGSDNTFALLGPEIMNVKEIQIIRQGLLVFPPPANPITTPINLGKLTRAILENIGYAIKGNCDQLAEISKKDITELKACGGLTKSGVFTRILADILDVPIAVPKIREGTSFGCAICAAVGSGLHNNLVEASREMVTLEKVIPVRSNVDAYKNYYRRWLSLYEESPNLI